MGLVKLQIVLKLSKTLSASLGPPRYKSFLCPHFLLFNLKKIIIIIIIFVLLRLHLQHMEVSRLGVKLELQLLTSAAATAMPDPSPICDLHHSSGKSRIHNPLSETRD